MRLRHKLALAALVVGLTFSLWPNIVAREVDEYLEKLDNLRKAGL